MDHKINKWLAGGLALGLGVGPVCAETHQRKDEPEEPAHAEYIAVTGMNNNANIAIGNASSTVSIETYTPATINLEWLKPHDRLVVRTIALVNPPL